MHIYVFIYLFWDTSYVAQVHFICLFVSLFIYIWDRISIYKGILWIVELLKSEFCYMVSKSDFSLCTVNKFHGK